MKKEVSFISFKAPYHAQSLANIYGHHFFSLKRINELISKKKIKKKDNYLFIVGGYTRANGYDYSEIVPLYEKLANSYTKTIITFAGSDILQINKFKKQQKVKFIKFLNRKDVTVAAVGDYMAKEVHDAINIEPKIIYMPLHHNFTGQIKPLPDKFRVGCYMPKSGNTFYGYDIITKVIRIMPDIEFHFYSLLGYIPNSDELKISNLVCHKMPINGEEMEEFLGEMSCGIRITEHDGNPMSLAEYNIAGRWFLFNKNMPYSYCVSERDYIKIAEKLLEMKHTCTSPNIQGSEFYLDRHSQDKFWKTIMSIYNE